MLDYSDEVTDIREQFPLLLLEETLLIAEKIGVKHPTDPKTGEPVVMMTDFFVTYKDKQVVRTVKSSSEIEDERTIEKFEMGLEHGTALAMFRHFIARKIWSVNMNERIEPMLPGQDFRDNKQEVRLAKGG